MQTTLINTAMAPKPYRADFKGPIVAGWIVVALTFGGFGAWAVTAPLSTGVTSGGTVVVDSHRKSVQHLEGGIVKEILVREGDAVKAGQPLVRLDETQVVASMKLLRGRLDLALAQKARLSAERAGRDVVSFPEDLRGRAAVDAEVADILAGQSQLFQARRQTLTSQLEVLKNRIAQSQTQIQGLERQVAAKDTQIALIRKELSGKEELNRKGYTSGVQLMQVERELARLEGERGEATAQIAQVRQAMNEAQLQILGTETKFREDIETELRKVEAEAYDQQERLAAQTAQYERLVVTAPVAGEVVDLAVHTVGGVVAPGSRMLDVVPQGDALVVEAHVGPADIDDVAVGMPAKVLFSAFNRADVPSLDAQVATISADRLVNEKTGAPYYKVRVRVADGATARFGLQLVPGMPAEVMINKGERTLFDYIAQPFAQVMRQALRQ